ncbi:MAG TPA: hypothetical protein VGI60_14585 [Chthoniobacterales bacterium]
MRFLAIAALFFAISGAAIAQTNFPVHGIISGGSISSGHTGTVTVTVSGPGVPGSWPLVVTNWDPGGRSDGDEFTITNLGTIGIFENHPTPFEASISFTGAADDGTWSITGSSGTLTGACSTCGTSASYSDGGDHINVHISAGPPPAITFTATYHANGTNLDFTNSGGDQAVATITAAGGDYELPFNLPGGVSSSTSVALVGGSAWSLTYTPPTLYGIDPLTHVSRQVDLDISPSSGVCPTTAGTVSISISAHWHTFTSPTPTPTPTPTLTPFPTPTPFPTATPGLTPPPGDPGPPQPPDTTPPPVGDGGPAETRYGDVYSDVRQALDDAGNQDTSAGGPISNDFKVGTNTATDGATDSLSDDVDTAIDGANSIIAAGKDNFSSSHAMQVPTVTGSQMLYEFTFPLLDVPVSIDLAPFSTIIGIFRDLCLCFLYLQWWVFTAHTIQRAIA